MSKEPKKTSAMLKALHKPAVQKGKTPRFMDRSGTEDWPLFGA